MKSTLDETQFTTDDDDDSAHDGRSARQKGKHERISSQARRAFEIRAHHQPARLKWANRKRLIDKRTAPAAAASAVGVASPLSSIFFLTLHRPVEGNHGAAWHNYHHQPVSTMCETRGKVGAPFRVPSKGAKSRCRSCRSRRRGRQEPLGPSKLPHSLMMFMLALMCATHSNSMRMAHFSPDQ